MNCKFPVGAAFLPRFAAITVATGMSLLQSACNRAATPPTDTRPAVAVQTITTQLARAPNIVEVVGTVRAKLNATVAAQVTAAVRDVAVKAGDFVAAGEVLATLDDRDLRAEFNRAKADYDRSQTLLNKHAATPAEFEAVESRYRVAEANLSHAQIVAPFDGQITGKSCDVGDLATPGKPLFTENQPTDFRLEVNVPVSDTLGVSIGKAIYCVMDATGEKCDGTVDELLPVADPVTHTVLAKISLHCRQPLQSGMIGHAQLLLGERFAIFVPTEAVHQRGQLTFVFIAADGKAQMRLVKTGKTYLDAVELLAGVQASERVIVAGEVADGQPVSP